MERESDIPISTIALSAIIVVYMYIRVLYMGTQKLQHFVHSLASLEKNSNLSLFSLFFFFLLNDFDGAIIVVGW